MADVERTGSVTVYKSDNSPTGHSFTAEIPADADFVVFHFSVRDTSAGIKATNVTVGGQGATELTHLSHNEAAGSQILSRIAPTTGAAVDIAYDLSATFAGREHIMAVIPYRNVHQETPWGSPATPVGGREGNKPSLVVESTEGDVVFAALAVQRATGATVDSPSTEVWTDGTAEGASAGSQCRGTGGSRAHETASSTTVEFTLADTASVRNWALVGAAIKPASTGPDPAAISEEFEGKDDHHLRVSIDSVDAAATHRLYGHTSNLGTDPATWESTATDLGAVVALDVVTWGGRAAETQYHFRVVSTKGSDKVVSNARSATTAPPRPTGLTLTTGTEPGEIALAWTNTATTADAIRIYFRPALSSDPHDVEVAAGNAISHDLTGLSGEYEAFTTAMRTLNADESGPSNTDSATAATDGDPPAAISDLAATAVSHQRIDLTWTLPTGATGVRIHRAVSTGFTPGGGNQIADLGAVSVYQDTTGLSAETEYFYKAVAFNSSGDAPASNEATATTLEEPAPAPLAADLTPDLMARIL